MSHAPGRLACKAGLLRRPAGLLLLLWLIALPILPAGCRTADPAESERLVQLACESRFLAKTMQLMIWLPEDYAPDQTYPVLYFLPDYGGSAYTVIHEYLIGQAADDLTRQGLIEPLIIVAVSMDRSFGLNSSESRQRIETAGGKSFDEGRYEDYFCLEVMPLIAAAYPVIDDRKSRFIGGYSMGGFAALYLAFRHPDLFSRVGGHSPSLFPGDFPDVSVSDWLYPDEETRDRRDPVRLARTGDLSGLAVYLDTGETDVNREGCALLAGILQDRGVPYENRLFAGTHSRAYCQTYIGEYLLFYAGKTGGE